MSQDMRPLQELVPYINRMELPEAVPVPARDIICNVQAIGSIARWGCFDSDVKLRLSGRIDGFTAHDFVPWPEYGPPQGWDDFVFGEFTHDRPQLTVWMNVAAMQQRLLQSNLDIQDPREWSDLMDVYLTDELRQAAKQHLIGSPASRGEILLGSTATIVAETAFALVDGGLEVFDADPKGGLWWTIAASIPVGVGLLNNVAKIAWHRKYHRPLRHACFSFVPGVHYDRLGVVYGISKVRRLVKAA